MSEELTACAHCDGPAYRVETSLGTEWTVYCGSCGAQVAAETERAVVAAWNRRASPPLDLAGEGLGAASEWAEKRRELMRWTGSAFLAGELVKNEHAERSELYSFLCGLAGWFMAAEDAAALTHPPAAEPVGLREALEAIDFEAPANEPNPSPTVGFPPSRDPEVYDGNDVVEDAFNEGVTRGLWQAATIARKVLTTPARTEAVRERELLERCQEELRLIRSKDTGAVYDIGLRSDLHAALSPRGEEATGQIGSESAMIVTWLRGEISKVNENNAYWGGPHREAYPDAVRIADAIERGDHLKSEPTQ